MARTTLMMVAARTKLIVKSGFNNYDVWVDMRTDRQMDMRLYSDEA